MIRLDLDSDSDSDADADADADADDHPEAAAEAAAAEAEAEAAAAAFPAASPVLCSLSVTQRAPGTRTDEAYVCTMCGELFFGKTDCCGLPRVACTPAALQEESLSDACLRKLRAQEQWAGVHVELEWVGGSASDKDADEDWERAVSEGRLRVHFSAAPRLPDWARARVAQGGALTPDTLRRLTMDFLWAQVRAQTFDRSVSQVCGRAGSVSTEQAWAKLQPRMRIAFADLALRLANLDPALCAELEAYVLRHTQ